MIVVGLGLVMHVLLTRIPIRRMTTAQAEPLLVPDYRTASVIGIGISELVALVAIVLTFFGAPFLLIPIGVAISLTGLWRVAPTQRLFIVCDERLQAQGKRFG
jgi:hypothetical protein